jgi:hypothetical protein
MTDNATTLPGFNPTKDPRVDIIKSQTEALIAYMRGLEGISDDRCRSIAITGYEQAAMWAVKSLFVPK